MLEGSNRDAAGGGRLAAAKVAASLKAASSTAVKSKCSPGERCAGPGARITFVLRSRALATVFKNNSLSQIYFPRIFHFSIFIHKGLNLNTYVQKFDFSQGILHSNSLLYAFYV